MREFKKRLGGNQKKTKGGVKTPFKKNIMETLLTNEFCEIKRTIEDRLLRIDLILNTEMYIPYFIDENGNLLK